MNQIRITRALSVALLTALPILSQAFTLNLRQQNEDLYDVFNAMVNDEGLRIGDNDLTLLDASSLYWDGAGDVEVYFINEGAGYRNQLLYTANGSTNDVVIAVDDEQASRLRGAKDRVETDHPLPLRSWRLCESKSCCRDSCWSETPPR